MPVDNNTGDRGQKKCGDLRSETGEPQKKSGIGHLIDKPADSKLLHPGSDKRNALPAEKEAEIAVPKRSKNKF